MDNANIKSVIPEYKTIDSDMADFREYIDEAIVLNQKKILEDVIDWERLPRDVCLPSLVELLSAGLIECRNEDERYASSRGMYFAATTLQTLYDEDIAIAFRTYVRGEKCTSSEAMQQLRSDIGEYLSDSPEVADLIATYMPEISGYSRADHCAELGAGALFLFGENYRRNECIKQTAQSATIDELMSY